MWPLSYKEILEHLNLTFTIQPDRILGGVNEEMIHGICTDSRKLKNYRAVFTASNSNIPLLFVAIKGEKFDGHKYLLDMFKNGLALALVDKKSEHVSTLPAEYLSCCIQVDCVQTALRTFAANFRKSFNFPVIAIGGSNGKTTTKEVLYSMLSFQNRKITKTQKSENGFLGVAFTILQDAHNKNTQTDALVLEIGIDEIGAMQKHIDIARPDVALLTALGPEHLSGLKNWETAVAEELILFSAPKVKRVWQLCDPKLREHFLMHSENLSFIKTLKNDMIVLEVIKEKTSTEYSENLQIQKRIKEHSLNSVYWQIETISYDSAHITITNCSDSTTFASSPFKSKIPLSGKHNIQNFALAFGAALVLDISVENITKGFEKYAPPPQRSKISHLPFDTILFDDTYNASPMSMNAALNFLKHSDWREKRKILVLGDMLELEDESKFWHENLAFQLADLQNADLCLFGSAMYNCYGRLKETRKIVPVSDAKDLLLEWSSDTVDPSVFLEKLGPFLKGAIILVKGSRGLKLERFVQSVENFFSEPLNKE